MADDTTNPVQTPPDPISSFKSLYPGTQLSDPEIYGHLSDPAKFKQVWPGTQLSDDDIRTHMQRYGQTRPDLQTPPPATSTTPDTLKRAGQPKYELNSGYASEPAPVENQPGFLKRFGQSVGLPTSMEEVEQSNKERASLKGGLETAAGPAYQVGKGVLGYGKRVVGDIYEGANEQADAGQNIAEGGPIVPNVLKSALGAVKPYVRAIPFIGPSIMSAGEDVTAGNKAGAAGSLTGVVGQIALPEVLNRLQKPPLDTGAAAEEIHNAVNPRIRFKSQQAGAPLEEYPDTEFKANVQRQLPRINQFAKDNGLKVTDQETLAQATQGAHHAQNAHFQENILGPSQNLTELTKDVPGYGGKELSPGVSTLRQLYDRLSEVNAELDPKYRKAGGGGQEASAAVRSASEAHAEASALRQKIYTRLAHETGQTPQQVAEANQAVGELRNIAETTRREAANSASKENDLRNQKWGATSAHSLAQEALSRVSQRLQPNPVDSRIADVFSRLNVPGYAHVPVNPPVAGRAQQLTDLTNASQLGRVPVNTPHPAAELGNLPNTSPTGASLARGSQSSPVPEPIANMLARLKPTSPTGEPLTDPPFSYPYSRGQELGEIEHGKETTSAEKAAAKKFYTSNPSALGRIPAPIKTVLEQRVQQAEAMKNPPAGPDTEVQALRKKLEDLQKKPKKETK